MQEEVKSGVHLLERCDPEQQASLQSEVVVNAMDAEQTWPTEDELMAAEGLSSSAGLIHPAMFIVEFLCILKIT